MLVCKGGQKAGKGTYWDIRNGIRIDLSQEGVLPGGSASTYLRMSSGVLLLAGPVIGLLYAALFPFISLAVVLMAAGRKAAGSIVSLIAKNISFHWIPKNAYLTGKKKGKKENSTPK